MLSTSIDICNYIGNEAWAEELEWTGGPGYTAAQVRDWNVDGKVAGYTKRYGGLTFATVKGAGVSDSFDHLLRLQGRD
jgi:cathepsin A (carboxypeptidase C)